MGNKRIGDGEKKPLSILFAVIHVEFSVHSLPVAQDSCLQQIARCSSRWKKRLYSNICFNYLTYQVSASAKSNLTNFPKGLSSNLTKIEGVDLGGLGVPCSPRDPRFARSNPAEVDGFFQDVKIFSTSPPGGTLSKGSRI